MATVEELIADLKHQDSVYDSMEAMRKQEAILEAFILEHGSGDLSGYDDPFKVQKQLTVLAQQSDEDLAKLIRELADPRIKVRRPVINALSSVGEKAITLLTQALNDPNSAIRSGAAVALIDQEQYFLNKPLSPTVVEPVLQLILHDPDRQVRFEVAPAMDTASGNTTEIVEGLVKAFLGEDKQVSDNALQFLSRSRSYRGPNNERLSIFDRLSQLLDDPDAKVRRKIIEAFPNLIDNLWGSDKDSAYQLLIEALNDPDSGVRAKVALAFKNLSKGYAAAIEPLTRLLNDPDPIVQQNARDSLSFLDPDPDSDLAFQTMLEMYLTEFAPDDPRSGQLFGYFWGLKDEAKKAQLAELFAQVLTDPNQSEENKQLAMWRLQLIGVVPNQVVPFLTELANNIQEKDGWRATALSLLAKTELDPTSIEQMFAMFHDTATGPILKRRILETLEALQPDGEQLLGLCKQALNDPDLNVRLSAAKILHEKEPAYPPTLETVIEALNTSDSGTFSTATGLLETFGAASVKAVPILVDIALHIDYQEISILNDAAKTAAKIDEAQTIQRLKEALSNSEDLTIVRNAQTALICVGLLKY